MKPVILDTLKSHFVCKIVGGPWNDIAICSTGEYFIWYLSLLFSLIKMQRGGLMESYRAGSAPSENFNQPLPRLTSKDYSNVRVSKNDTVLNNIVDASFNRNTACLLGADGSVYSWFFLNKIKCVNVEKGVFMKTELHQCLLETISQALKR